MWAGKYLFSIYKKIIERHVNSSPDGNGHIRSVASM